jgi:hypothetical protein
MENRWQLGTRNSERDTNDMSGRRFTSVMSQLEV